MSAAAVKPARAASAQLAFDLACRSALGAEDFLVAPSNREAVALVDRWPEWPHWAAVVVGPARSGKSHLANVWRLKSGAIALDRKELDIALVARSSEITTILVEDIDQGIANEQALFHLLNLAREHRLSILITSRIAPGDLDITLPDLRSRMRALPVVSIYEPDENLLRAVLVKHFSDRQLMVEPPVIDYLATYMERSMEAAARVVEQIDQKTLATRRRVSQTLAREILVAQAGSRPPRSEND